MTKMVQVAVAGDVAEAEQLQSILLTAGIDSELETAVEQAAGTLSDLPLRVLVSDEAVDAARDAIEALSEPDDIIDVE